MDFIQFQNGVLGQYGKPYVYQNRKIVTLGASTIIDAETFRAQWDDTGVTFTGRIADVNELNFSLPPPAIPLEQQQAQAEIDAAADNATNLNLGGATVPVHVATTTDEIAAVMIANLQNQEIAPTVINPEATPEQLQEVQQYINTYTGNQGQEVITYLERQAEKVKPEVPVREKSFFEKYGIYILIGFVIIIMTIGA